MKTLPAYGWLNTPIALSQQQNRIALIRHKYLVVAGRSRVYLPIRSIVRIEGEGCGSRIYTADGKAYTAASTLSELMQRLTDFVRLHKSHLVNPAYITGPVRRDAQRLNNRYLRLSTGERIPVSRHIKITIN